VLASRISYVGELGWELYVPDGAGRPGVGACCTRPGSRTARSRSASASTAHRAAGEGLPGVRLRAGRRAHDRRGRDGPAEGQERRLRRAATPTSPSARPRRRRCCAR
jgi:hypothetical protein